MELGWKVLIPLSLVWLLVVAAFRVGTVWGLGVFFGGVIVGSALWQAVLVGRARREVLEASRAGRRGANDSYLRAVPEPDGGE
jgi:NADH-quinone oxidoreductase subunit H